MRNVSGTLKPTQIDWLPNNERLPLTQTYKIQLLLDYAPEISNAFEMKVLNFLMNGNHLGQANGDAVPFSKTA